MYYTISRLFNYLSLPSDRTCLVNLCGKTWQISAPLIFNSKMSAMQSYTKENIDNLL